MSTSSNRPLTTTAALALFDGAAAVTAAATVGNWHGAELYSGHRFDGLLHHYNWHGKRIVDSDTAYPLIFNDSAGGRFNIDTRRLPAELLARLPVPKIGLLKQLFLTAHPLFATDEPQATIQLRDFRGVQSAAIVYDHLPIIDHLRRIDDNSLIGLMQFQPVAQPYFFLLRRE